MRKPAHISLSLSRALMLTQAPRLWVAGLEIVFVFPLEEKKWIEGWRQESILEKRTETQSRGKEREREKGRSFVGDTACAHLSDDS